MNELQRGRAVRSFFNVEAFGFEHAADDVTSDTLRIVGSTAWDVGTTRLEGSEGGEQVSHYLTVLRRGSKFWKIERLALVPESRTANAADSAAH